MEYALHGCIWLQNSVERVAAEALRTRDTQIRRPTADDKIMVKMHSKFVVSLLGFQERPQILLKKIG